MKNWQEYKLGSFLKRQYDSVQINDFEQYKRITIRSKGQGIELRDEVNGIEIGTKNQFKVKYNQFLLSKIDALNGAFGIVPEACDGGIITGNFWTYDLDETILLKEYLNLLCLKQVFTKFSFDASEGTTNRKYLRENKFLNLSIKLPSIAEQRLIVAKVEKIKSKLRQITSLRAQQANDVNNLLFSKFTELKNNAEWASMKEVAPIHRRQIEIDPDQTYFRIGVRSFGRGLFENPTFKGSELTWQKIFRMNEGDLLFSNANGWEGAVGLIPKKYDGWVGSHRYITCLPNLSIIDPEFLFYYFKTNEGVAKLSQASPGTVARTRTLNTKLLMQIEVPVPSIESQIEFVTLLEKINRIKEHHKQTQQELEQLLPSLLDKAFKGELFIEDKFQQGISIQIHQKEDKASLTKLQNDDLELAMIVALMESKLGNTYGEVGIQKTVFNIEAFNPALSKKYNFVNYHYGTYSAELKENLKSNPFLGKKIIGDNEVFTIRSAHRKTVLNAIGDKTNLGFVTSVNQLLDIYTIPFIGKHTDKIELLNTVTKLIMDLQTTDVYTIHDGMKQWEIKQLGFNTKADKFTSSDTEKTIELLISTGMIKQLLA